MATCCMTDHMALQGHGMHAIQCCRLTAQLLPLPGPLLPMPCRTRRAEEARRGAIIAEERRKLLAQAAELAEFLPPGVVKDKQELEMLRQAAQQRRALQ